MSTRQHHNSAEMDAGLETILPELDIQPDLKWKVLGKKPRQSEINFIHRRLDDGSDLYFVANGAYEPIAIEADFRVAGRQPQLWRPDTGEMELAANWRQENGRTKVELDFDPAGSVFVVFRPEGSSPEPEPARRWESAATQTIEGPWRVAFQPDRGAPENATFETLVSWPERQEFGVKHFSGTATYHKTFQLPEKQADAKYILDLGDVKNLAGIKLNGRDLGTLWKTPFQVDVSDAVQPGENQLEIAVTNLWTNRMIGDEQLQDDADYQKGGRFGSSASLKAWPEWLLNDGKRPSDRVFLSSYKYAQKDDPLVPSGLLGPVTLRTLNPRPN